MPNQTAIPQSEQAALIHSAFDETGVTFHNRPAALASLKASGREVTFDDNGQPVTEYDGHTLPLREALLRFGYDNRGLVDGRTLPREGVGSTRPGLASKSDFPDIKSKIAFIEANGEDAWARLPLTTPSSDGEIRTQEEFDALPVSEKVARINADEFCRRKLPRVTRPDPNVKAVNQKQEMANNLAKHIASRGVGRR